jgi:hypothetical protein
MVVMVTVPVAVVIVRVGGLVDHGRLGCVGSQPTIRIARGSYAATVARVDPDDDSIYRWVVRHCRYDSDRRERRHVVVAAFDNPDEFHADIEKRAAQLRACKERGDDVDPAE